MLLDHLGKSILLEYKFLTYIGRLSFPIFAFLIVEGFYHTKNLKKYITRILMFAIITEIPFNLLVNNTIIYPNHQNVLWTFLLSILCMNILEKTKNKEIDFKIAFYPIFIMTFVLLGIFLKTDYNGLGVLTVLLFYFFRIKQNDTKLKKIITRILQLISLYIISCYLNSTILFSINNFNIYTQNLSIISLLLIWLYNEKQGLYNNYIKYLYYLFYPIHIIILFLLKVLLY